MEIKDGHLVIQMYEPHDQGDILGDCYSISLKDLAEALAPYMALSFAELMTEAAKGRETFSREDLESAWSKGFHSTDADFHGGLFGLDNGPFREYFERIRDQSDRDIAAIIERKE